ncbi:MAG: SHP2/SHP3 family peptide pheromone [Lactobacillus iners]|nr:SHP2/SHP3 family peptide pheromone [Lactobacillus iners]
MPEKNLTFWGHIKMKKILKLVPILLLVMDIIIIVGG